MTGPITFRDRDSVSDRFDRDSERFDSSKPRFETSTERTPGYLKKYTSERLKASRS